MLKSRVSLVAAFATLALTALPMSQASAQLNQIDLNCELASFSLGFSKCWSFDGNDKNQDVPGFLDTNESAGATWTRLGATDGDPGETDPFTGNLPFGQSGTLNFAATNGWFALAFKQANAFSLYTFYSATTISSLEYNVLATDLNSDALSHTTYYDGKDGPPPCDTPGAPPCEPLIVPEPTSFALMFGGLLGLGVAARRRRNS